MSQRWWLDERAVKHRAARAVRAALRQRDPEWIAFLERRWERKWRDFWPDYCEDFSVATSEDDAHAVLTQLVERFVDWVADYFVDVDELPRDASAARQPQPVRVDRSRSLARRQAQLARARWFVSQDARVCKARALLGDRLLAPHEALLVLHSPLLARWDVFSWQRSGLPLVHQAEVVRDSTTIKAYWEERTEALRQAGLDQETAAELVREKGRHSEVVRVTWEGGARLVSVPRVPRIEPALLNREPLWLMIDDPSHLPPQWLPGSLPDGPVMIEVNLPIALSGSPLAVVYQAAERVRQVLGYPFVEALRWLLLGESEGSEAVGWGSAHIGDLVVGTAWVELTLATGLPSEEVLAAYRRMVERVSRWLAPGFISTRPLDERTVALARFWHEEVERTGQPVSYEALRRAWNARHPAWGYDHAASFWRALRNSVREVYGVSLPRGDRRWAERRRTEEAGQ